MGAMLACIEPREVKKHGVDMGGRGGRYRDSKKVTLLA